MILQKITDEIINKLIEKQICCFENSSYINEFCQKYEVLDRISLIVDNNANRQGTLKLNGHEIPVVEGSCFCEMELKDYELVITGDYFREAFEYLSHIEKIRSEKDTIYYFANQETEYEEYYRNLYKDSVLQNKIIFRSGPHLSSYLPGMDFSDNAKALFEYMLKNNYNEKYELIWFVKNPDEYQEYTANKNVSFIALEWSVSAEKEKRDAYYRALCLAKYIFFTDAYGIARNCRADQIRVQLWHGCGFKTRLNFSPCSKRYEYMTVTSELYADIHSKVFGLQRSQLLITGCAKEDWLFQTEEMDYFKELHIPNVDKYIFWLPTYRKADDVLAQRNGYELNQETGLPIVDTQEKVKLLNTFLAEKGIALVIKLHPYQNREKIALDSCSNIILLDNGQLNQLGIHINHLLGRANALISDYSSAAVDYLLLDRPIAFMLDDLEEYESSRGFVFDNIRDWLPGEEIFSFDDLLSYLEDIAEGKDSSREKRHVLTKRMHANCDGNNCRRIVEALQL